MSETDWDSWIEEAITKNHIKHYEYEHFSNIQEIGLGGFGKVYRANWKNSEQYIALKSLLNLSDVSAKELVHEIGLQREVAFHNNIITFYGITISNEDERKKYLLVMEYADGGSLNKYLRENFMKLDWDDKYKLAYQLACAVACLHDEGIVHRDLHSKNVLVHQGNIKLADFGLSKKVEETTKNQSDLFGVVPYIDPKKFESRAYSLSKKSDVYSIGVVLWEISKGEPPFYVTGRSYEGSLAVQILQGHREATVPGTPVDYVKLYTECWDGEPDKRPTIHDVADRLKKMVSHTTTPYQEEESIDNKSDQITSKNMVLNSAESYASHGEFSQFIQNFDALSMTSASSKQFASLPGDLSLNSKEIDSITSTSETQIISQSTGNDLSSEVRDITKFIFEITNKINEVNEKVARKLYVLSNFKSNNIDSKEIYNWLLYNQKDTDSIFLLGYFNYYGIETNENNDRAFNLFLKSSRQNHILSQYFVGKCHQYGYGTRLNEKLAFEYFKRIADQNYAMGQLDVGYCYNLGMGVREDLKKAFDWYEKAAENGNVAALHKLGQKYINGMGIDKDYDKAFELFKKSAEGGYINAKVMLGVCYSGGIGTSIDWKKAIESYQEAANLGSMIAQYNLATMYKNGEGTEKDIEKAIYWYKRSAEQGYSSAEKQLKKLNKLTQ